MADAYKNFAISSVATAPSPATSGVVVHVTAGHGTRFPATPFNATVWPAAALPDPSNAEIVRVTSVATDVLTITRAQEGSTARAIVIGDLIAATITKKLLDELSAAGGQLAFPSTQNPSANANTLDDYEEGTFTPVDSSGASLTFATASGEYLKIGGWVHGTMDVTFPTTGSGAAVAITLPFTAKSTATAQAGGAIITYTNVAATHTCYVASAAGWLSFFDTSGGAVNNNVYSGKIVRLAFSYRAAN